MLGSAHRGSVYRASAQDILAGCYKGMEEWTEMWKKGSCWSLCTGCSWTPCLYSILTCSKPRMNRAQPKHSRFGALGMTFSILHSKQGCKALGLLREGM